MYDPRQIILRPIVTEKSFDMAQNYNRFTFEVAKTATKTQISQAVADVFGVTVLNVNTMNVNGKPRRVRFAKGLTRSWKKAIVTLKKGDTIDAFPGV